MPEIKINNSTLRIEKGDLTTLQTGAIVFYARNDLVLGSGFGNAITVRGGASIQEELKQFGEIPTCEVVITGAGKLKSDYIIHAVGPKFQESDLENKLRKTMINTFKAAAEKKIRRIAFPPMGAGFYGIPLQLCARIMIETIINSLSVNSSFEEVLICVMDNMELKAFRSELETAYIKKG